MDTSLSSGSMDTSLSSGSPRLPYVWPLPGTQGPNARMTWDEWCAWLARHTAQHEQPGGQPFGERELAHLRFVRWLYHSGRLAA